MRRCPCQRGLWSARATLIAEIDACRQTISARKAMYVLRLVVPEAHLAASLPDEGPRAPVDEAVELVQAGPRGRDPDKLLQGGRLALVALAEELLGDPGVQRLLEPESVTALQARGRTPSRRRRACEACDTCWSRRSSSSGRRHRRASCARSTRCPPCPCSSSPRARRAR